MIIRQSINFAVHLAGGVLVGVLAVAAARSCRKMMMHDDRLEPRTPPPADPMPGSTDPGTTGTATPPA